MAVTMRSTCDGLEVDEKLNVFTHDLDFGSLLAATNASEPSVLQVRTQNVMPQYLADIVVSALRQFETILQEGALVTVDEERKRARVFATPFEKHCTSDMVEKSTHKNIAYLPNNDHEYTGIREQLNAPQMECMDCVFRSPGLS